MSADPVDPFRRTRAMIALIVVLAVEALGVLGVAVFLLYELLTEPAASLGGGIAIVVIGALAAAWLVAITIGAIRSQPWIRGAALTWQLVQLAIAAGSFQGIFARPDIGWVLLVPALVAIVLLLSPSVTASLRRD